MSQETPWPGVGALVEARGDRWRVVEVLDHEDCASCRLLGAGAANAGRASTLLLPFDRPRVIVRPSRLRRVGRRRWMIAFRSLLAGDVVFDGLRCAAGARLDLLAYQLEPALACARGATRVLIADEVGLGKTIQAGLVLSDLGARGEIRALVLAPAGLCAQWRHELLHRFSLDATVIDAAELRRVVQRSPATGGPWEQVPLVVSSIDFVKRPEVLQGMAAVHWDILVVDEAHLAAVAPERAAAVGWLARRSRRVVLLTATPHPGEPHAFEALCGVGHLPGEGPILMFRRTRAGLGLPVSRHVRVLAVGLSVPERRMHAALTRYTNRVWRENTDGTPRGGARLAMIVLRKRAASGAAALVASLTRRLEWLRTPAEAVAAQLPLPLEPGTEEFDSADEAPSGALAAPGMADATTEQHLLARLLELARAAGPDDSKTRALVRLLRRVNEPAIVFTEYRDTLVRLAQRLSSFTTLAVLHGGLDWAARGAATSMFDSGRARVLLATDAAAHGLNLQAQCRLVIDIELPWSPVRLEQRIGRVDRIGQRRTVHAVHLVARDTSEEHVLARLVSRVERIRRALGPGANPLGDVAEADVADGLFTRRAPWLSSPEDRPAMTPCDAQAERATDAAVLAARGDSPSAFDLAGAARQEAVRLDRVRRLAGQDPHVLRQILQSLERAGPWWTTVRFRHWRLEPPRGLVCVYRARAIDARGALVDEFLVCLVAEAPGAPAARRSWPGECLGRRDSALRRALDEEALRRAAARLASLHETVSAGLEPLRRREAAIAASSERVPVIGIQPGLFDRRALQAADREREVRRRQREDADARAAALARASDLSLADDPQLLLVMMRT